MNSVIVAERSASAASAIPEYLAFRGKAQPDDAGVHTWHPVAYHCLDVTACLDALLNTRPQTLARASRLMRLSLEDTRCLLRTLVVLHDIGKFSEAFFGQTEALWPSTFGTYEPHHPRKPHTAAGYALWRDPLRERLAARITRGNLHDLDSLFVASFGHHGRPLKTGQYAESRDFFKSKISRESAEAFALDVVSFFCDRPIDPPAGWDRITPHASWWVAGLISISDWLGSNQRWFPYHAPSLDIASYWDYAQGRAKIAVREAGLTPPQAAKVKSFAKLTATTNEPTPAQRWALEIVLPRNEGLFILEDVTGAGKTEAAHVIVHRLMAEGRASGAYWAMPTQATANAMYLRQREMIAELFDSSSGRSPSLILTHGQAKFHKLFRDTVLDHCALAHAAVADNADDEEGSPSTIACASFLADDRRAGLLADIGAGTIDQVLMGVLPSKFNTIRLFGLAEKVLVLDEVHAYDAYMREEIITLLKFHSALGGSAIVLSATLPEAFRQSLVRAWQDGSGHATPRARADRQAALGSDATVPYPLATVVDGADALTETEIDAAPWSCRTVPVRFLHETNDAVDRICEAARRGEAVAWIRNTVDSCLEAAELLRAHGIEPMVFHARFAQCDRQAREADVLAAFGPKSRGTSRARVLVATQVIEQSLDLDFDTLVTDLAPIDLIIQRAGRLWRHQWREARRPTGSNRELIVLTPRFTDEPGSNWLDSLLPKTKNVYEDVGVLWRSLKELHSTPSIETPGGVRRLVESVYASIECPDSLQAQEAKAEGKAKAHSSTARNFVLRFEEGYCGDSYAGWYSDIHVPTRLIDKQTTIRLGKLNADGTITPWADTEADTWRAWALSEVRVSASKIPPDAAVSLKLQAAVDLVRKAWPRYEREVLLVPLVETEVGSIGKVQSSSLSICLSYTFGEGLRIE